ncbi:hypothetical protein [Streptomyces sp. BH104]|uniref:hypothetical protein n=1 Tax=Streptomyces sp. BH104 TaxID=3410407 RepID=UPI003BB6D9FC
MAEYRAALTATKGQFSGLLALGTAEDVDAAVQSAAETFETWSTTRHYEPSHANRHRFSALRQALWSL